MDMLDRKITVCGLFFTAVLFILPSLVVADEPTSREYPYLYKSSRAMGMGGAYTAVGGRVDTLFYNPAGLANIPKDKGWEVDLLNVSAEAGKNAEDFLKETRDALNTGDLNHDGSSDDDQQRAVNDVLAKYRGENLHARVADFTALGKNGDKIAFGLGGLGSGRIDAMSHQGFSSDGVLEVNADVTYGGIGGISYAFTNDLFIGVTVKSFKRESIVHKFTTRELVDHQDDMSTYIKDDLKKDGSAVGYDAGLIWKFAPTSPFKPSFGLSVLNIGDLDFGAAGKIPMSVNAGVAVNPTIPWFRSLTLAADYVDITKNFTEDKDNAKRIRYGAELQLFDKLLMEMTVRAGMYEGYPTFGADLRLFTFLLSYSQYTEEIGAYAGQDKDKRQLLTFNFGW
jgi:hypothetical protein